MVSPRARLSVPSRGSADSSQSELSPIFSSRAGREVLLFNIEKNMYGWMSGVL
jgi:hypothetical protein